MSPPPSEAGLREHEGLYVFAEEAPPSPAGVPARPWKVVVADDDAEVHDISNRVLSGLHFEGRPVQCLSAHSGAETLSLMREHPDVALLLLDVVMESDDAGLAVVRQVREILGNGFVRIVLRTGQAGCAPEESVVIDYDINDYKEKTELTARKLITTVVAALRAYRDIETIERSRRGLQQVIDSSRNLFSRLSLPQFADGALRSAAALWSQGDAATTPASGFTAHREPARGGDAFRIVAGLGDYAGHVDRLLDEAVAPALLPALAPALAGEGDRIGGAHFVARLAAPGGAEHLLVLHGCAAADPWQERLMRVLEANLAVGFDNVLLNRQLLEMQEDLIDRLGEVMETRSAETGHHVLRVGEFSRLLGQLIGLPEAECDLLRLAAPLHDLGKVGIPDALLNKPGRLTPEEFEAMKAHAAIGHRVLKGSRHASLQAAAVIAHQHHEWWDGSGYPQGLRGEGIHVYGRIVALADVFDALLHARCYKEGWDIGRVLDHVRAQRGTHFDPRLVDLLCGHVDAFLAILRARPDPGDVVPV